MNSLSKALTRLFLVLAIIPLSGVVADTVLVTSQHDFEEAVKHAGPGDVIQLASGNWNDFEILFRGKGTADAPITLTAEEKGNVIITGRSNLRLAGEYLVVSGLVFRDGYTPTSEVISFRRNKEDLAYHSRVTEVVIDSFNNPERTETDYWVVMYGKYNRFDHNHIAGKKNNGVTMAVRLNSEASQENHHRIDHNYFGHRPNLGSNGGETLRIGTSHYSLTDSFTLVENNFFERCNGEVEIVSNKSGHNVFRGNVFLESRGTLTLRHGNDNLVENNVFFGNGVDHTGGIRLINKRQTIRNNYMQGLTGHRFASALTIMNGVPDSPINRYHQVEDSVIENNTVIDSAHIEMAAGSDAERSAVPISTAFRNNLVYNRDGSSIITVHDDISGIEFEGNLLNKVEKPAISRGFSSREIKLQKLPTGLMRPVSDDLSGVGASASLTVLDRDATGVDWYPKPDNAPRFDTGNVIQVGPESGALFEAVTKASAGDIIELAAGDYLVTKLIELNVPVTLRAADPLDKPSIEFERTALFEIKDGGSLKLTGLKLSGKSAPDNAGNALIRTSRYSMLNAYDLLVDDCEITDLDINHSFNFLTVAKGTLADRIDIRNSRFENITGAVLELDKETDDLGLYNAEYVTIVDSQFENIGKALAVLYRGGTDESTFGPHFSLRDSGLSNVGMNKRNKSGASVSLLGVQLADVNHVGFAGSAPIKVVLTVGGPVTHIVNNTFKSTPAPEIFNGEATLTDNKVVQ
ncbi:MAG: chondroitinase-B domain-containing protein [Xanthomonadales bacterium]|jgi:poly(beta-D-mannuronate) lyase|nr:chondroitinase-B domain-containing protein [Xanthomonadales bacterium]